MLCLGKTTTWREVMATLLIDEFIRQMEKQIII